MRRLLLLIAIATLLLASRPVLAQESFRLEKLTEGVFAALALPGGAATSNALLVEGPDILVAAGAHWSRKALQDLVVAAAGVSDKPLGYVVLTHHHPGYSHIDFDFPPGVQVLTNWQTWQALDREVREVDFPVLFFQNGLTLRLGNRTLVLTNLGPAHTAGDVLVFLPGPDVLYAGDLVYDASIGYLGEGYMQEWVLALEFMEQLEPKRVIPGFGPVGSAVTITRFKTFFREFLTEVLKHLERGESLEQTLDSFALPAYREWEGYDRFLRVNLERAYRQLGEEFPGR